MKRLTRASVFLLSFLAVGLLGMKCQGLNVFAMAELSDTGVDQYVGQFTPAVSEDQGNGWTRHTFDTDGGDGPICIAGTPFTSFTNAGNPTKLVIFLKGWLNRLNALRGEIGLGGLETGAPLDFGEAGYIGRIPDLGEDPGYDI